MSLLCFGEANIYDSLFLIKKKKELPCSLNVIDSVCNAEDPGSIPGLGRSSGDGNGSILAWGITWTEKPGGLQSAGWQRVRHD